MPGDPHSAPAEKTLVVADLTASGERVPLSEIMTADAAGGAYAVLDDLPRMQIPAPVFVNRPEAAKALPVGAAFAPPMICSLQGCFLVGPFGQVVLPSGALVRQSVLNFEPFVLAACAEAFKEQLPGRHIMWATARAPVLSVNTYSCNNYFHFLVDALGDLHWQDRLAQNAALIVAGYPPERAQPFVAPALARLGLTMGRLFPFDGTILFCHRLIFPRRDTGATPWRVEALRKRAGLTGAPRGKRRLYIYRHAFARRRIANDKAIEQLLAKHGFEAVNPGALSFDDQVKLFSDAAIVLGPHGAGLANAVFMSGGGAVIELTHDRRVFRTFHELAAAAGHAYACVIGEAAGDDKDSILADFTVDPGAVEAAIKAAVAATG